MILAITTVTGLVIILINLNLGYYGLIEWSPPAEDIDQKAFSRQRAALHIFSVCLFSVCTVLFTIWMFSNWPITRDTPIHRLLATRIGVLLLLIYCILIGPYLSGKSMRKKFIVSSTVN